MGAGVALYVKKYMCHIFLLRHAALQELLLAAVGKTINRMETLSPHVERHARPRGTALCVDVVRGAGGATGGECGVAGNLTQIASAQLTSNDR